MEWFRIHKYISVVICLLLVLPVMIPHHHHSNGTPCYHFMASDHDAHKETLPNNSSCNDIMALAFFKSQLSSDNSTDSVFLLTPVFLLFDYFLSPEINSFNLLFRQWRYTFIESIHNLWISCAKTLRAPPVSIH